MALHHVNFHTLRSIPVFENEEYDQMMRQCLADVLSDLNIICPAWEILPTHVHMIVEDFADLPRATILKYVKGDTSRAFFGAFPYLRADLDGGHLWQQGYNAVLILTHRQYRDTLAYVRANRRQAGLVPPPPLWPGPPD